MLKWGSAADSIDLKSWNKERLGIYFIEQTKIKYGVEVLSVITQ